MEVFTFSIIGLYVRTLNRILGVKLNYSSSVWKGIHNLINVITTQPHRHHNKNQTENPIRRTLLTLRMQLPISGSDISVSSLQRG